MLLPSQLECLVDYVLSEAACSAGVTPSASLERGSGDTIPSLMESGKEVECEM